MLRQRGGKVKTEKEVTLLKQYNTLVKAFNASIGGNLREQATLALLKEKAEHKPLVVFTMGIGHRRNYLSLINHFFKGTRTAFVIITPPALLLNGWIVFGVPVLVLVIVFLAFLLSS